MNSKKIKSITKNEDDTISILCFEEVSRYDSNGIISSLVSIGNKKLKNEDVTRELNEFKMERGDYQEALDSITYTVWDMITPEEYFEKKSYTAYEERLENVARMIPNLKNIELIDSRWVKTYEEAMAHFQEAINLGFEGTVLKAHDGPWKDGRPNTQIKMKLEIDVDLKIVGFNYGTGKNASVISSVDAESSDGLVYTSPTGMDEKTMKYVTANQDKLLGAILETKCCGLSNDSNGNYSLLHPVYLRLRTDEKNIADSLEDIKKIEAMAKGLVHA